MSASATLYKQLTDVFFIKSAATTMSTAEKKVRWDYECI